MVPSDPAQVLREGLEQLCIPEPDQAFARLTAFLSELERWNPRFGLVKYESRRELVVKHMLDSLSAWTMVRDAASRSTDALIDSASHGAAPPGGSVLDVGSGAGFPGIPLAVALPELSFTLVERMARRASFLKTCAILLGLSRVRVLTCDLGAVEGEFDVVTFRAVAPLARFLDEIGKSSVRWGRIIAYKGKEKRAREEMDDVRRAAGSLYAMDLLPLSAPFLDEERCLIVLSPISLLTNG
ncbi:MAG: 16S rRNA (guanine(527)-N(7))-methyltransferase RsmG [Spirochaetia bacterium]|jgi:16S rRNA (guanine527-N7)-methyltransferase